MIKVRIFEEGNPKPIGIKDKEVAHIRTLIRYDDSELFFLTLMIVK